MMKTYLKTLFATGALVLSLFVVSPPAYADHLPTCPYENHNACCGWIFIGSKGIKLFDCW